MKYIYQNKHEADAALIICMDFRFYVACLDYVKNIMGLDFDLVTMAGSQKNIAEGNELWQATLKTIQNVCVKMHHIKKIVVLAHQDCGAYGGSKNFAGSAEEEQKYRDDLAKAKKCLRQEFSELEIIVGYCRIVDGEYDFSITAE